MRRIAVLFALACSLPLFAQSTEADLRARLVAKPLYLRGLWRDDHLKFDETGRLLGSVSFAPFSLAGVVVDSVELNKKGLVLACRRVGTSFERDVPRRQTLLTGGHWGAGQKPEAISIEIKAQEGADFGPALHAIFADDLAELVPAMPEAWQSYGKLHFHPHAADGSSTGGPLTIVSPEDVDGIVELPTVDSSVVKPRLLRQPDPKYNPQAEALRYEGEAVIGMVVDAEGRPRQLRIVRPTGIGLDEQALDCVARYVFQPAMRNGLAIPVRLNVAVSFLVL